MRNTRFFTLFLVLLLSISTVFAQANVEKKMNESLVQVNSIKFNDDGYYDILATMENGTETLYHVAPEVKINFPLDKIYSGMYLYVIDNGIATRSLPPQTTALEIKNVTLEVRAGILSFGDEAESAEPLQLGFSTPNMDDMFSRFSYSYGYLTAENFLQNGIVFDAGYYARGILDAGMPENEPFYPVEELADYFNDYVMNHLQNGEVGVVGNIYSNEDELLALKAPETLHQKFSYAYGYVNTMDMLYQGHDIRCPEFAAGSLAALYDAETYMTLEQIEAAFEEYNAYLYDLYMQALEQSANDNLKRATDFLEENKTKDGIITLESGVQIEIIDQEDPESAMPTSSDRVIVDYSLMLLDGTVADQGDKVEFSLDSLIPGFVDAVMAMHVGDTAIAYIPPELGYGEMGAGESIAPNSLLIFTIYLDSIVRE